MKRQTWKLRYSNFLRFALLPNEVQYIVHCQVCSGCGPNNS